MIFIIVIVFIVYQHWKHPSPPPTPFLQLAGEPPANITENQTVAIIMKKDALLETLNLGLSILCADLSLLTVGIVDTGSPNIFISNQKFNQLSVTISPPDAEVPSFVRVDNTNQEILGQTTIYFILKDAAYTYSAYVVKNLVKKVILGLFLFFSGAQIDLIRHNIHFEKPHSCYTRSCHKPMAVYLQFQC